MSTEEKFDFPEVRSKGSLVAKFLTQEIWDKLKDARTKTAGCTLMQCIACAVQFDNQHVGVYAGDEDCYVDFAALFDPVIQDYHQVKPGVKHVTDMNSENIKGNVGTDVPVKSTRIRVGRNIMGYGLSPGITKQQRIDVEALMIEAFKQLPEDLAGTYYPLTGMAEKDRQQLVDDHFLFVSGDRNLQVGGMERDWPEGRGIFVANDKRFLVWVNEEDQLRIISMQPGGDVLEVFDRLCRGIKAVEDYLATKGKKFMNDDSHGYYTSCPTNLGTGMRASVHIELPAWKAEATSKDMNGKDLLQKDACEEMGLQARGSRGESGGETGCVYDLSNKYRLGYSEVQLVQMMIDGVNKLWEMEQEKAAAQAS